MVKVKMSLVSYNKFVDFIGKEWVEENCTNYQANPNSVIHPFIKIHFSIINSQNYNKQILPKEIYNNILLRNYQKYNFIGSFIEKVEDKLPNPTRFKNDLKNPDQYENTLFELISFGILLNSNFDLGKKKEEKNTGNPDFYITNQADNFTVECTRCNIPGAIDDQGEYSAKFQSEICDYFDTIEFNSQIYLSTSLSFKDECDNLIELTKEVLSKRESGKFEYCDKSITILNTITKFKKDEYHQIQEFVINYPLLSMLPSNLGSTLLMDTNLIDVRNVREIALNFDMNVYRKIRSTLLNKISKNQSILGHPHYVFLMIPANFTTFYEIDDNILKNELSELLTQSDKINSVFVIYEKFYKDSNNAWAYKIEWNKVKNLNSSINQSTSIDLKPFSFDNFKVEDNGNLKRL